MQEVLLEYSVLCQDTSGMVQDTSRRVLFTSIVVYSALLEVSSTLVDKGYVQIRVLWQSFHIVTLYHS